MLPLYVAQLATAKRFNNKLSELNYEPVEVYDYMHILLAFN